MTKLSKQSVKLGANEEQAGLRFAAPSAAMLSLVRAQNERVARALHLGEDGAMRQRPEKRRG
eukprot:2575-Pleurochrysis_carterae.AAC.2